MQLQLLLEMPSADRPCYACWVVHLARRQPPVVESMKRNISACGCSGQVLGVSCCLCSWVREDQDCHKVSHVPASAAQACLLWSVVSASSERFACKSCLITYYVVCLAHQVRCVSQCIFNAVQKVVNTTGKGVCTSQVFDIKSLRFCYETHSSIHFFSYH